jgi:hypothetical protein
MLLHRTGQRTKNPDACMGRRGKDSNPGHGRQTAAMPGSDSGPGARAQRNSCKCHAMLAQAARRCAGPVRAAGGPARSTPTKG